MKSTLSDKKRKESCSGSYGSYRTLMSSKRSHSGRILVLCLVPKAFALPPNSSEVKQLQMTIVVRFITECNTFYITCIFKYQNKNGSSFIPSSSVVTCSYWVQQQVCFNNTNLRGLCEMTHTDSWKQQTHLEQLLSQTWSRRRTLCMCLQ